MKILSTFNTQLEQDLVKEYKQQFGENKVISVHKSPLFYRRYIGLPLAVYVVLLIVSSYFLLREDGLDKMLLWGYLGFFLIYAAVLFAKISSKWVDYKMDFLIVTPKEIVKYDQSGMFTRQIEKLHADKIKSISISKPGFMNSVFDIGSITFMAEGDNDKGDIVMDFIDAVEAQERKMVHVLGMDVE